MKRIIALTLSTVAITNCTWVNENKAGRDVAITVIDQVSHCQKVGDITSSVKNKVGFINRNSDKVIQELLVLARNEAVKLNANTIVSNGAPVDGKQTYQAFSCPQ